MSNNNHVIQLKADGHVLTGVEIHETHDGERDKFKNLKSQGGVEFITRKGKRLFLQFSEFSFVVNPSQVTLQRAA